MTDLEMKTAPLVPHLAARLGASIEGLKPDDLSWTDVRLGGVLECVRSLADNPVAALRAAIQSPPASGLEELVAQIERLNSLTVTQEFNDLMAWAESKLPAGSDRNIQVLRDYIFDASETGATMADLGVRYGGVTRERVRQLMARVLDALLAQGVWTPAADRLVRQLAAQVPVAISPASEIVQRLGADVSFTALLRWQKLLGRSCVCESKSSPSGASSIDALVIDMVSPQVPVTVLATDPQFKALRDTFVRARAQVRRRGAFRVEDLAREAEIDVEVVQNRLKIDPSFAPVLPHLDWYWFGSAEESRLAGEARSLLSVLPSKVGLTVEALSAALLRAEKFSVLSSEPALPLDLLLRLVSSLPDVELVEGRLRLQGDLAKARERYLTDRELAAYAAMAASQGVMSRQAITNAFLESGKFPTESIHQLLHFWPGATRLHRGVLQLVGWAPPAAAIERAKAEAHDARSNRISSPASVDQQASEVTFDYLVRESAFSVNRINVPITHQGWFAGNAPRRYRSDEVEGLVLGTGVEAKGPVRIRRIAEVFEKIGAREGDAVRVTVRRNGSLSVARLPQA